MSESFCDRLKLRWPIVQAPMAGVQDHRLAAAVCASGALGSLPAAMLSADALRAQMLALREQVGDAAFNVNFFSHRPGVDDPPAQARWRERLAPVYAQVGLDVNAPSAAGPARAPFGEAALQVLRERPPAVVSFHFGLPEPGLLLAVKALGAQVWASATTLEEGLWLQAHGADAVIAQGLEAGGHRGHFLSEDLSLHSGSFALLPQLVKALRLPVIAAGGIADAAGVRAALALGASAVQVGTAYLLCDEAQTSAVHRAALQSEAARHTALTTAFTGRPARGIVNRLMRELGYLPVEAPPFPSATAALAPLRAWAEARGSGDFSPLWAGQNTSGCRAVPAAQLTAALALGCDAMAPGSPR
jgi:nitronate monooxygenase